MKKWEYRVLTSYPLEDELNKLGDEGWELIAVVPIGGIQVKVDDDIEIAPMAIYGYLKREKLS